MASSCASSSLDEFFSSLDAKRNPESSAWAAAAAVAEGGATDPARLSAQRRQWLDALERLGVETQGLRCLGQERQRRRQQAEAVAERAERVKAEIRQLEEDIKAAKAEAASKERDLGERRAAAAAAKTGLDGRKDKLKEYCNRCKDLLGIDMLVTSESSIIMQFDKIDPADPSRQFKCELKTNEKESEKPFSVVSTSPDVGSEKLAALEAALNGTNGDLSGIAVALRWEFRTIALKKQ